MVVAFARQAPDTGVRVELVIIALAILDVLGTRCRTGLLRL